MVEEGGGAATPSPDPARTRQANEKRLKNLVENRVSNCVGVVERREAVGVSVFLASDNDRERPHVVEVPEEPQSIRRRQKNGIMMTFFRGGENQSRLTRQNAAKQSFC